MRVFNRIENMILHLLRGGVPLYEVNGVLYRGDESFPVSLPETFRKDARKLKRERVLRTRIGAVDAGGGDAYPRVKIYLLP